VKRFSAQASYNDLGVVVRTGETPPERARLTIQDRKSIVTIAWNSLRFPLIVVLPKGRTFNAEYYRDNILATLTQLQSEDDERKLVVHVDNARTHTAKNVEVLRRKWIAARSPSTLLI
jgi:hypothetical protein